MRLDKVAWRQRSPHPHSGPPEATLLSLLGTVSGFSLVLMRACGLAQNKGFAALLLTMCLAILTAATTASGDSVRLAELGASDQAALPQ